MFLSETHLPQVLPLEAYNDQAWFDREREQLFRPAWHAVATTSEIPVQGDFVTVDVCGFSVIVHNADGEPRAYVNCCPHRLSQLTHAERGRQCRLKCQYHGWEFDADGSTRRIPDAPGFRPLEKGRLGLVSLATAVHGQLVFVRLGPGPSLPSFLGSSAELIAGAVAPGHVQFCTWSRTVEANWKLVIENTLESYHVGEIHRRTLGAMPEEGVCRHDFDRDSSTFTSPGGVPGLAGAVQARLLAGLGLPRQGLYRHHILLPALCFSLMDDLVILWTFEPLGPRRTRLSVRGFGVQSPRAGGVANRLLAFTARRHLSFWSRVWVEDLDLYPDVQAGVDSPTRPGSGLLSRREERVHHFQSWIHQRVAAGRPAVAENEDIETGQSREVSA